MRLRGAGQIYDPETDYDENGARYYDPTMGQYLAPDPFVAADAWDGPGAGPSLAPNPYQYAMGDPLAFVDVNGLHINWALAGAIAIRGGMEVGMTVFQAAQVITLAGPAIGSLQAFIPGLDVLTPATEAGAIEAAAPMEDDIPEVWNDMVADGAQIGADSTEFYREFEGVGGASGGGSGGCDGVGPAEGAARGSGGKWGRF